jgi:hypothetical protein
MSAKFSQQDVIDLLVKCHRRCCICHRYCGVKVEIDHIVQAADDGTGDIANAIVVCFECHAEIHSYNDRHPRGRKFRPEELRKHKEQWLAICAERPETLVVASWDGDVGPLQALVDELEFNAAVAKEYGCLFLDNEFHRAIREGVITILDEDLKAVILAAYVAIGAANRSLSTMSPGFSSTIHKAIEIAKPRIEKAHEELVRFLRSENP